MPARRIMATAVAAAAIALTTGVVAQASPATPTIPAAPAAQWRYTDSFPSLALCEERGRQDIGGRVQKFRCDEVPGQWDLYEFTSP